jgi:SAM-dependent methyltransferase
MARASRCRAARLQWAEKLSAAMNDRGSVASAWEAEYCAGRYRSEPPVAFTGDILAAARASRLTRGLYIGCGNGRNYLPLVAGGLDLTGLDISATALAQLAARRPGRRLDLICGDLSALPSARTYPLVIGIQVFQQPAPMRTSGQPRRGWQQAACSAFGSTRRKQTSGRNTR